MLKKFERIFLKSFNFLIIGYNLHDLFNFLKFQFERDNVEAGKFCKKNYSIKTFVISLKFRNDRRENIKHVFSEFEIPYNFYDALHGKTKRRIISDTFQFSKRSEKYLSDGSIGCIASHLTLWNSLIKSRHNSYLIFEDDVLFTENMLTIDSIIEKIPSDFDIIYLGSKSSSSWLNMKKVSSNLYKPFCISKGAHSYFISKKGAYKLLKLIKKIDIVCGSIDTILGVLMMRKEIISYHFLPSFTNVDLTSESNIYNISDLQKKIHKAEFI